MGTLVNRWKNLDIRDKRALLILFLIVPIILFWNFISKPLNDRLALAHRVLATSRQQASELQRLLNDYVELKQQLTSTSSGPSSDILTILERALRELPTDVISPEINRATLAMQGVIGPAAQIKISRATPKYFWELLTILNSNNLNLYEVDLTTNPDNNSISATIKVWAPTQN